METSSRALVGPEPILGNPSPDRSKPQHHFFAEGEQYRLKVQRFSKVPCEVTIQRISFEADQQRYRRAAENGFAKVSTTRRQRNPDRTQDEESIERSKRRAKTGVRLRVAELGASALVTFTTRKTYTLDHLASIWARFVRAASIVDPDLAYLAVPEPHPSNPSHLHLHAATRWKISISTLRRLWHIAIEAHEGRRVARTLYGAESPGNIDVQSVKGRDTIKRIRKIGRYISKYITKDLLEAFNRKRYWPSKGINLQAAQVFWLDSLSQAEAIREGCEMLGHWDGFAAPAFKLFRPSDRVAWYAVDLAQIPDPPF